MRASEPQWESNWRVKEFVPEDARKSGGQGRGAGPGVTADQLRNRARPMFERMMVARNAGVNYLVGTDSLMGGVYFGLSLHWEIAQFVDAGFSPIDALRMATERAAALVGATADLGSLTTGKLADIVLLDSNPLENIRNTQSIWQVVKGGRVYDPQRLRQGTANTPVAAAGVTGNWKVVGSIGQFPVDLVCTLNPVEKKVTGKCVGGDIGDVAVIGESDGKAVTWSYGVNYQGQPLTVVYTGTLDSPTAMKGTISVMGAMSGSFTASRQ
jgi:hypothetical protein